MSNNYSKLLWQPPNHGVKHCLLKAFVPYTNIIHLAVATTKGGISGSLLIKNLNVIEPIESIIPQLQLGLIITPPVIKMEHPLRKVWLICNLSIHFDGEAIGDIIFDPGTHTAIRQNTPNEHSHLHIHLMILTPSVKTQTHCWPGLGRFKEK
jgi:hypothetical protein